LIVHPKSIRTHFGEMMLQRDLNFLIPEKYLRKAGKARETRYELASIIISIFP
jgi:hypothetical protein